MSKAKTVQLPTGQTITRKPGGVVKHNDCFSSEHNIWNGIKERCFNPKCPPYKNYGGRGITVCDRWKNNYSNFLLDMGRRPSSLHTLDRIDNNGNYEPNNCRWAIRREQMNNTRVNRRIEINGEYKTIREISDYSGLKYKTLYQRIVTDGLSVIQAISMPIKIKEELRTHCPQGHPYNKKNTYSRKDKYGRECRKCRNK